MIDDVQKEVQQNGANDVNLGIGEFREALLLLDNLDLRKQSHPKPANLILSSSRFLFTSSVRRPFKFTTMRLTTELINSSLSFINCITEREVDLRGTSKRADTTLSS